MNASHSAWARPTKHLAGGLSPGLEYLVDLNSEYVKDSLKNGHLVLVDESAGEALALLPEGEEMIGKPVTAVTFNNGAGQFPGLVFNTHGDGDKANVDLLGPEADGGKYVPFYNIPRRDPEDYGPEGGGDTYTL